MKRVHKVQGGFALIFMSQGLMMWAGIEASRRAEIGDSQWPALGFLAPAFCLGIIGIWLLITGAWFMHKQHLCGRLLSRQERRRQSSHDGLWLIARG